ncbi:protein-export membrane protein SecD [Candidatus Giovannonibacteria bacterium RIFCSPLOWO2_01_FULL_43_160]|uniref:Protein translocase subunit SecD n=2 Tax=Candidatus Giovannoniibacteriota TaxID=1752738 RepID=A0A0G1L553_9BACT|nr:MAG: Preprotein translocase subunit SecD [Candidatus Giovannonibacteria bacterium GW2011_GWB1_43_13]KKS99667.1 MAG: Preprotein translocase subunit SecD [Candidatus Giovannonibacteria bacterium GW2011_GWA1_43_15]KKT21331.1 MAG: Preprotein translocase subunit SecD [Candidatus Giovannonibacteria bacterium GW2011_GWC2_43_8]KKT63752.1 MAG: Preprotein translocase subunit SecD [Candidatus Giovannonibacteria bacterium GW2011_GWA2_44_26]OGF58277.1 MAG: protein-export membrane protein SecD [Candidatus
MKVRAWALIILIIGVLAGFYDSAQFLIRQPADGNSHWLKPFQLGLDLQGGTHLVYQADTASIASSDVAEAIAGVRDIIERRVNLFGVAEPVVQTENVGSERRLIVELAGVFDIKEAIKTIGETPFLEFKELKRDKSGGVASSTGAVTDFVATNLTGRYLKKASLNFAQNLGEPEISLEFNDDGAKIFEEITARNVGEPVAIFLDGAPISIPVVREKITGGKAQITGKFSVDEARQLVRRFNAGALPVPIVLISQQSIGSSLGKDALFKSLRAALYGTIAVMLFMIFWYRLPGLIAVLALGVYSALTLLLFKLVPVTLSSAGIAGFILSVGMAVDANILIFERMKEEIRSGKFLDTAMAEGFRRAWTSIRDSNVSSLITSVILYWFGTSIVRGFALTLGLGILVSMFSAITASRYFLFSLPHKDAGRITRFLFGAGLSR